MRATLLFVEPAIFRVTHAAVQVIVPVNLALPVIIDPFRLGIATVWLAITRQAQLSVGLVIIVAKNVRIVQAVQAVMWQKNECGLVILLTVSAWRGIMTLELNFAVPVTRLAINALVLQWADVLHAILSLFEWNLVQAVSVWRAIMRLHQLFNYVALVFTLVRVVILLLQTVSLAMLL